ncbi:MULTISPECIES: type-F conjugative transfer system pilin assembly protein TrbC [Legionella]|uniref:type-F conjugative transfer system pilin assembly protein TrbC n=1 Tax=Legionella TaxID=445 RepID=UPI00095BE88B|nr:type-F conjugative transfer system pilin assembly protein TrbC [Legionella sp. 39-23]OJW06858.1 MAG: type-F conjugative transfer system pilin assembly protein TrbC [Legionella sp. 39-23]
MRLLTLFLIGAISQSALAKTQYQVFVSFSMPNRLLEETLRDAAHHGIPVLLNGFVNDSMRDTAVKIFELTKKVPNCSMQIDPTAFERYGITQVPAFVAVNQKSFDVVLGNITMERAMDEVTRFGDTARVNS